MTQIKGCIFDLDGVLVDTAVYHFQAWKALALPWGFELSAEQNEQLKGISRVDSLERLLLWSGKTLSQEEKNAALEEKNKHYLSLIDQMNSEEVLPGVKNFLEELQSMGMRIALGSASKNAGIILEKTGLLPFFHALIDGNQVQESKPHPEVFLKGALALGLAAQECLVFEDAAAGIEAATRAGMRSVGLGEPQHLAAAQLVLPNLLNTSAKNLLASLEKTD